MLDKYFKKSIHLQIQFIALLGISIGLPFSKIPLSLGMMLLGLNVIGFWDWKSVWNNWVKSTFIKLLMLFLALQLLSVFWSENLSNAADMLRKELPLYVVSLCVVALPILTKYQIHALIYAFVGAVFLSSFINVGTYFHWWGSKVYDDIRSLSLFISHIRFALMVALALTASLTYLFVGKKYKWIAVILVGWFIFYLILSQVGTGILVGFGVFILLLVFFVQRIQSKKIKIGVTISTMLSFCLIVLYLSIQLKPISPKVILTEYDYNQKTVLGNSYTFHSPETQIWENGYPIFAYLAESELRKEWNKVSDLDFDTGKDSKGFLVHYTLIRYMTSKGLRKDSLHFHKLTPKDIQAVEQGIPSVEVKKGGLSAILYRLRYQLHNNEDPNGKSLLERKEYLKAGLHLIQSHFFFGVGLGDIQDAFHRYYVQSQSKLALENQHITHNQFITVWIIGGIACFLAFCSFWVFQFVEAIKSNSFLWLGFLIITCLSFLIEDTLQTQTGVTFVAFFAALFCTYQKQFDSNKKGQQIC